MDFVRHGETPDVEHTVDGVYDDAVELWVPATADQIPLVRTLSHAVVTKADFGLDAIADATMAVDEACAQLVQLADFDARLGCRIRTAPDGVHIEVSTRTREFRQPDNRSFGWHVLTTLARSVTVRIDVHAGQPGCELVIELVLDAGTGAVR